MQELRAAYSSVPVDELDWLYNSTMPTDCRRKLGNAEDSAVMAAELVALELQQLLGVVPALSPPESTDSPGAQPLPLRRNPGRSKESPNSPQLSIHAASMALVLRGKFRANAHLGLSSHLTTPKTERKTPWLGHDNLGKRKTGVGEFGPATSVLHPGAAIPRYD